MKTIHKIAFEDSREQLRRESATVDLVVTSPPYPMVEMWDDQFAAADGRIAVALERGDGYKAFELMHSVLDGVWFECSRLLREGAFACINIGDATRRLGDRFRLYSNHARIIEAFTRLGFDTLPCVLWRKQTNAPNKFMGSGMLPSGAYVTLEHEYILIFRKGAKREFNGEEKERRRASGFFWEERNVWFSDVWNFKGVRQPLGTTAERTRSGAFPFELPYRLINMYSLKHDLILDPFVGTGTTTVAAAVSERNSTGYEIDTMLRSEIWRSVEAGVREGRSIVARRLQAHDSFVREYAAKRGRQPRYTNTVHNVPVVTNQERGLSIRSVDSYVIASDRMEVTYRAAQLSGEIGAAQQQGAQTLLFE